MAGHVAAVDDDRVQARGLDDARAGELVHIAGVGPALVVALHAERAVLAMIGARLPGLGSAVHRIGPLRIHAGDDLLGRVTDPLGRPVDGGAVFVTAPLCPLWFRDPYVVASSPGPWRLTSGLLAYDLQHVMRLGARVLVIGGSAGLVDELSVHHAAEGRVAIVVGEHPQPARGRGWIGVAASTPTERWLAPWAALAIADAFAARGRDVVVRFDLDAWQRVVPRFAEHGAWPTQLGALTGHAYRRAPAGSVSVIACSAAPVTDPPTHELFDHVLPLASLGDGVLPRRHTKRVRPPLRMRGLHALAGVVVRSALGQHAIAYRECLRWQPGVHATLLEQLACLLAVDDRVAADATFGDDAPAARAFADAYLAELRAHHATRLAAIAAAGELTTADQDSLAAAAGRIVSTGRASASGRANSDS